MPTASVAFMNLDGRCDVTGAVTAAYRSVRQRRTERVDQRAMRAFLCRGPS